MPITFSVTRQALKAPVVRTRIIAGIRQMAMPVLKQYAAERSRLTNRFKGVKPEYGIAMWERDSEVLLLIVLKNARQRTGNGGPTLATLMEWLFVTGTKAHPIAAKNAKFLAFQTGYSRLTTGGSGQATGPVLFRQHVNHPGFAPSPELKKIDDKFRPIVRLAINAGFDIGFRNAR